MSRPDSLEVVLRFVGPAVRGAPARDLTRADIARLAYRRAFASTAGDGIRPPKPSPEEIRRMTGDLVARGRYARVKKES
jgi:hypothetical protein